MNKPILIMISLSLLIMSCNDESNIQVNKATFDNSAVIFYEHSTIPNGRGTQPIQLRIVSFNSNFSLESSYYISGIHYTDDGSFNDKTASDGIYTSIEKYENSKTLNSIEESIYVIKNDQFDFNEELELYIKQLSTLQTNGKYFIGVKFKCKVKTVTCPETSWWNTCWPLSSPCNCLEFYDCEIQIGTL
jgi:hypothetical protein